MAACSLCGSSLDEASHFCPRCGALTRQPKRPLYGAPFLLALVLVLIVVVGKLIQMAPPQQEAVMPTAPDEAAVFIRKCGQPDVDNAEDRSGTMNRRSLLYRKAKVQAVFIRSESEQWKVQVMLDSRTLKPLTPQTLAKRLPCAAN